MNTQKVTLRVVALETTDDFQAVQVVAQGPMVYELDSVTFTVRPPCLPPQLGSMLDMTLSWY